MSMLSLLSETLLSPGMLARVVFVISPYIGEYKQRGGIQYTTHKDPILTVSSLSG